MGRAVRLVMVAAAVVAGWLIGGGLGLLTGIAIDKLTANAFVSGALATIPIGALLGSMAGTCLGVWIMWRTRSTPRNRHPN
jgi:hypothetical protein